MRKGAWAAKGLLAVALVFLLRAAELLLVPVVAAVVLTFVLVRPLRALRRAGVPEFVGAAVLAGALLGGTTLLVSSLAAPARHWMEQVPLGIQQVLIHIERLGSFVPPRTAAPTPQPARQQEPPERPLWRPHQTPSATSSRWRASL